MMMMIISWCSLLLLLLLGYLSTQPNPYIYADRDNIISPVEKNKFFCWEINNKKKGGREAQEAIEMVLNSSVVVGVAEVSANLCQYIACNPETLPPNQVLYLIFCFPFQQIRRLALCLCTVFCFPPPGSDPPFYYITRTDPFYSSPSSSSSSSPSSSSSSLDPADIIPDLHPHLH